MTTNDTIAWPVKTRELLNHQLNSAAWNGFHFRDDDIVIATYAKSGTTWMQQIVSQLVFGGAGDLNVHEMSPWVELRILPPEALAALDDQTHRRFIKTHLPVDALVYSPKAKYIFVGRDGRDAAWSFHNHSYNAVDAYFDRYNEGRPEGLPPLVRSSEDPYVAYKEWFDRDGFPIWPFWQHVRSWWEIRGLPNIMMIHFNDLKKDLPASISRVASFLDIEVEPKTMPKILHHCSFDYMKLNADQLSPRGGAMWIGGGKTFINKGSNGRWRDRLTAEDVASYEARAIAELGPDCARWLAEGGPIPD